MMQRLRSTTYLSLSSLRAFSSRSVDVIPVLSNRSRSYMGANNVEEFTSPYNCILCNLLYVLRNLLPAFNRVLVVIPADDSKILAILILTLKVFPNLVVSSGHHDCFI